VTVVVALGAALLTASQIAPDVAYGAPRAATSPKSSVATKKRTALMKRAHTASDDGRLLEAARLWRLAFEVVPRQPMALYNAAFVADKAGEREAAIADLERFLRVASKENSRRRPAQQRLRALRAEQRLIRRDSARANPSPVVSAEPAPLRPPAAATSPSAETNRRRPAASSARRDLADSAQIGWWWLGGGGLCVASAAGLFVYGLADFAEFEQNAADGRYPKSVVDASIESYQRNDLIYAGTAGFGVLMAAYGVWRILDGTPPESSEIRAAIVPNVTSPGASFTLRF